MLWLLSLVFPSKYSISTKFLISSKETTIISELLQIGKPFSTPLTRRKANAKNLLFQKLVCSKLKIQTRLSYIVFPSLHTYMKKLSFSLILFFTVVLMEPFLIVFVWVKNYNTGFLNKHSLFPMMIKTLLVKATLLDIAFSLQKYSGQSLYVVTGKNQSW